MKVIRDLKKDGLTAEHSEGPTGPVLHIFTRNPPFLPFYFFISLFFYGFDLKLQIFWPQLEG